MKCQSSFWRSRKCWSKKTLGKVQHFAGLGSGGPGSVLYQMFPRLTAIRISSVESNWYNTLTGVINDRYNPAIYHFNSLCNLIVASYFTELITHPWSPARIPAAWNMVHSAWTAGRRLYRLLQYTVHTYSASYYVALPVFDCVLPLLC